MNSHVLNEINRAAVRTGWEVIALVEVPSPPHSGTVPHGFAAVKRDHSPLGPGREYATARWYVQPTGGGFESGDYDLTREGALSSLAERAGLRVPMKEEA